MRQFVNGLAARAAAMESFGHRVTFRGPLRHERGVVIVSVLALSTRSVWATGPRVWSRCFEGWEVSYVSRGFSRPKEVPTC